ncbi:MAG: GDP-mannose 4,6-dehydratase [Planctomycetales bacterium]|nr:GDP-mannose 4,6-dehydratase [Planctomycetales bacterium]
MKPTALITGVTGQDGSYLAELLLAKNYAVHGYTRNARDLGLSAHLAEHLTVHRFDSANDLAWKKLLKELQPAEVYHLAADSYVPNGWENPSANLDVNGGLTLRLLEAIRRDSPQSKFLNACSREIFGDCREATANELTPMQPETIYGISKAAASWSVHAFVRRYDLFACNAILFNHESPRRHARFVTRKISQAAARIALGVEHELQLGNLAARRDWGYAGDYVKAMWQMLQIDSPEDFVLGTGVTHSIEDFVRFSFESLGLNFQDYVRSQTALFRPEDAFAFAADISKAQRLLGWQAETDAAQLAEMMTAHDLRRLQAGSRQAAA